MACTTVGGVVLSVVVELVVAVGGPAPLAVVAVGGPAPPATVAEGGPAPPTVVAAVAAAVAAAAAAAKVGPMVVVVFVFTVTTLVAMLRVAVELVPGVTAAACDEAAPGAVAPLCC